MKSFNERKLSRLAPLSQAALKNIRYVTFTAFLAAASAFTPFLILTHTQVCMSAHKWESIYGNTILHSRAYTSMMGT